MNINKMFGYTVFVGVIVMTGLMASAVHAAPSADSKLQQVIGAGVVSTDIRNASNAVVSVPTFTFGAASISNAAQSTTGVFGDSANRISVDNPGGANAGWTLSLNAKVPGTGTWTSGANSYPYNGTAVTGQLSLAFGSASVTAVTGAATGVSKASGPASFTGSAPITIMSADASSADIWNGYIIGIGMTQVIPASQPAGTYTLDMTQTVATI